MKISASYYSAIGARDKNEDAVLLLESGEGGLGIVADGLGGHSGGKIASRQAVKIISSEISQEQISVVMLRDAINAANMKILEDERCSVMKTTIAVLWFDDKNALAATVGDTRIYQFRNNQIIFQSKDHSVTQLAVFAGELAQDGIRGNKNRNQLIRALGARDEVKADIVSLKIKQGDAFLVCSDGFWDKVWEKEMLEDLGENPIAGEWLQKMRNRVEGRTDDRSDNHTAIAIIMK